MGFLHGQDRLWQMEFDRLVGQGRLAEVLGEAALPLDRFLRTLGLAASAEAALAPARRRRRLALLEAYAAGVNAAIAGYGVALPPEFLLLRHRPEPWRPVDSLLFQKLMALDLSRQLARGAAARPARAAADARTSSPTSGRAQPPARRSPWRRWPACRSTGWPPPCPTPPPPGIGSNVWVVDGSRTASGRPLLANDPHLRLQMPGHWYLAQLEAPGLARDRRHAARRCRSSCSAATGDIAWGFTNTGSDTQDLFVERLDPADPGRYLTPDGSEPFRARAETITVRGAAPVDSSRSARPGTAR